MNIKIEIAQEFDGWNDFLELDTDYFVEIVERILIQYPNFVKTKEFELSVLLTDNIQIKSLNAEFRGKNITTNVLSFPDTEIDWRKIVEFSVNPDYMYLGDIAFCFEVIVQESNSKSIKFQDHFKHLAIHAILHLIGYDHMNEIEAETMEAIEVKILNSFGISSPY